MYVPFEAHVSSAEHTSRPCNVACGVSVVHALLRHCRGYG